MVLTTTSEMDFRITALLCDSVVVENGKLYIQGAGWTVLNVADFSVPQPRIGLGLVVHVPYVRTNAVHRLDINLQDDDGVEQPLVRSPDGATQTKVQAQFNIGRPPNLEIGAEQPIPFALNLDGLVIPGPARYSFMIAIDDEERARLTFTALSVSPVLG
jgi:hypothetical protein